MKIPDVKQELKKVVLTDLVPYEDNPRVNDDAVQYIADSIKEFGFIRPIGVDEDLVLLYGHTALKAAKKLKMGSVTVVIHRGMKEDHKTAYRIADNRLGERSYWDYGLLEKEMKKIIGKMKTDFIYSGPELKEMFNFDIIKNPDLKANSAKGHIYAGNALALQIHNIVCFIDDPDICEYITDLSDKLLDVFDTDQKKYNEFGTKLMGIVKKNEGILL